MLIVVNPGSVFSSLRYSISESPASRKSTRASPAQSIALYASIASRRTSEDRALDLARLRNRGLDDDLSIEGCRERDRRAQLGDVLRLRDADARSEVRRLHEHGEPEMVDEVLEDAALVALPVALHHDVVVA